MKIRRVSKVLLAILLAAFIGCGTSNKAVENTVVQEAVVYVELQGTVASVDKYGNVQTDISVEALAEAGYELGDIVTVQAGNINDPAPYVSTYSDVNRGNLLINLSDGKVQLAINYGNLSERGGITVGNAVTLNLAKKGAYRAEYEVRHLTESEKREDYPSDAAFANFREVKYGAISSHTLYRSRHPASGDAKAPYAAALDEGAGIKTVINLADNAEEFAQRAASSPWYQKLADGGNIIYLSMGVDFGIPDFQGKLKTGLQYLISHEGPYLIHCNEGKDRTGMVVALLEAISGATIADIKADYIASFVNQYGIKSDEERYSIISQAIVDILQEINGGIVVNDRNLRQTAENYLTGTIGLSAQELASLKARLSK
ncbi:putative lipoprotein [Treponema primitia ZAS-2]|uniref:Putative lipoprotein n=1 Tax=Treponema primitia (strain ATCC BAA-887 / DSM 12427 / ZAS-2) TaxID=545694 RepID=F5YPW6_TREPZ|nr:tyrosine-protein phosphatase [Treponema primitia]AEF86973.1 putative lipoprotein [Treponema primitia ZAS-2]